MSGSSIAAGTSPRALNAEGRQTETYTAIDPEALGLQREPVTVEVDLAGETVTADVWRYDVVTVVGTVPLYLLDVDLLTDALYSGDREHRIRQELLLGVGGVRALAALGLEPTVFHVNEATRRSSRSSGPRCSSTPACRAGTRSSSVRRSTVFTTHTPVPAGNEVFGDELVLRYAGGLAAQAGISDDALLGLGRSGETDGFGLTPLALRLSAYANGVSALHGAVAREMWAWLWPDEPPSATSRTACISAPGSRPSSTSSCARSASAPRHRRPTAHWEAVLELDPEAIWNVHAELRRRLARLSGADADLLTIGFARRFATYKRAGLVFSDLERLLALPVQIVVAGKAHPQDAPGKDVMQRIVELSRPGRRRTRRVPRELQHRARPGDHPGLRHLAEHTEAAATRRRERAA